MQPEPKRWFFGLFGGLKRDQYRNHKKVLADKIGELVQTISKEEMDKQILRQQKEDAAARLEELEGMLAEGNTVGASLTVRMRSPVKESDPPAEPADAYRGQITPAVPPGPPPVPPRTAPLPLETRLREENKKVSENIDDMKQTAFEEEDEKFVGSTKEEDMRHEIERLKGALSRLSELHATHKSSALEQSEREAAAAKARSVELETVLRARTVELQRQKEMGFPGFPNSTSFAPQQVGPGSHVPAPLFPSQSWAIGMNGEPQTFGSHVPSPLPKATTFTCATAAPPAMSGVYANQAAPAATPNTNSNQSLSMADPGLPYMRSQSAFTPRVSPGDSVDRSITNFPVQQAGQSMLPPGIGQVEEKFGK